MKLLKPKALRRADIIGICAPASPPNSEASLSRGISYLEQLGYRVEIGKNVWRKRGYLAGSDTQRASDLNDFFSNPKIKAIFSVRGGYGSHRILPLLNYNLIKRHPKILVGYSDITALQLTLFAKAGLITFSGPMVASEMAEGLSGNAEELFWRCLTSSKPIGFLRGKREKVYGPGKQKTASGRLLGGNLSLTAALVGTPYFPTFDKSILLLEEIDERPYRIDRMLQQLKLAGVLRRTKGIVLGSFINCVAERGKPSLTLRQALEKSLPQPYPLVVSGFHYGHVKNSLTFPIGIRVQLHSRTNAVQFLEASVD